MTEEALQDEQKQAVARPTSWPDDPESTYKWGFYRLRHTAQDQAWVELPEGVVHGLHEPRRGSEAAFIRWLCRLREEFQGEGDAAIEQAIRPGQTAEQIPMELTEPGASDTEEGGGTDDVQCVVTATALPRSTELTPEGLATEILQAGAADDLGRLRNLVLHAEDMQFTPEQSERLAPWLLDFAERYRDTSDTENQRAVLSAIRTGASMLRPGEADRLLPLLEPGHPIETTLVALKMVGRIFEAQPPNGIDTHTDLATEVQQMAEALLNRYALASTRTAATADLAIYAMAAMAHRSSHDVAVTASDLGVTWFSRRVRRNLERLADAWENHPQPVADGPRELLEDAIAAMCED